MNHVWFMDNSVSWIYWSVSCDLVIGWTIKFATKLAISLCPIVANMTGLIGKIAPKAHRSNCAQGSSVELRPGLIRRSAPGLIRRTAPGRMWAHRASKYTWKNIVTYWLNGRWFLQIVDGDSGNLYIQYNPLFPCSDFWSQTYQMWGWFGGGGG